MKNFLLRCWDFIWSVFLLFLFCVDIVVATTVCYTFPNIGIIAGVSALVIAIILKVTNKK